PFLRAWGGIVQEERRRLPTPLRRVKRSQTHPYICSWAIYPGRLGRFVPLSKVDGRGIPVERSAASRKDHHGKRGQLPLSTSLSGALRRLPRLRARALSSDQHAQRADGPDLDLRASDGGA